MHANRKPQERERKSMSVLLWTLILAAIAAGAIIYLLTSRAAPAAAPPPASVPLSCPAVSGIT